MCYGLFIHLPIAGHLCFFQFEAIMSKAALNIWVDIELLSLTSDLEVEIWHVSSLKSLWWPLAVARGTASLSPSQKAVVWVSSSNLTLAQSKLTLWVIELVVLAFAFRETYHVPLQLGPLWSGFRLHFFSFYRWRVGSFGVILYFLWI